MTTSRESARNLLITGGAGFVGSNLALWFKKRHPGWRIVALDNLKRRGSEFNLPRLREHRIEFLHADVRSPEDFALGDFAPDTIFECSAEPSVLAGYGSSPAPVINTNLVGTVNCLELARKHGAAVIFLSTSRVYPISTLNRIYTDETESRFVLLKDQILPGVSDRGISEQFPLEGPRSLYGATKLCSELLLHEFGELYNLQYVVNRCGVIAGPWQMGRLDQGVFTLWVARHHFRGTLDYIGWGGKGTQVRDLLHVDDLAALIDLQVDRLDELKGRVFNVGGGVQNSLSLLETTRLCEELTGNRIEIGRVDINRPADIKLYLTDNSAVTKATSWEPTHSPRQTLTDIHEWIRAEEPLVRGLFS